MSFKAEWATLAWRPGVIGSNSSVKSTVLFGGSWPSWTPLAVQNTNAGCRLPSSVNTRSKDRSLQNIHASPVSARRNFHAVSFQLLFFFHRYHYVYIENSQTSIYCLHRKVRGKSHLPIKAKSLHKRPCATPAQGRFNIPPTTSSKFSRIRVFSFCILHEEMEKLAYISIFLLPPPSYFLNENQQLHCYYFA